MHGHGWSLFYLEAQLGCARDVSSGAIREGMGCSRLSQNPHQHENMFFLALMYCSRCAPRELNRGTPAIEMLLTKKNKNTRTGIACELRANFALADPGCTYEGRQVPLGGSRKPWQRYSARARSTRACAWALMGLQ